MKAIVLAGGLGTRLSQVTNEVPKPLATVGARPFLEYVLDYLRRQGIEEAILAVSYRWKQIQSHFGNTYRGFPLRYSVEEKPLGTGGAIMQAMQLCRDSTAVVVNGDTLFEVDLNAMANSHGSAGAQLTIALAHVSDCSRYGSVVMSDDGDIVEFGEKSEDGQGWINGGIYMMQRSLFDELPVTGRFSFEHDLVEPNIGRIQPHAFKSDAYFIDMGIPEDYERAQMEVGNKS